MVKEAETAPSPPPGRRTVEYKGRWQTQAEWARELKVSRQRIHQMLRGDRLIPRGTREAPRCGSCGEAGHNRQRCPDGRHATGSLKALIQSLDLKVKECAEVLGVSEPTMRRMIKGVCPVSEDDLAPLHRLVAKRARRGRAA